MIYCYIHRRDTIIISDRPPSLLQRQNLKTCDQTGSPSEGAGFRHVIAVISWEWCLSRGCLNRVFVVIESRFPGS